MRFRFCLFLTLAVGCVLLASTAAAPRTPFSLNDLKWRGMYAFPTIGTADTAAGTTQYTPGTLAVRYVNGERRFLMPTFRNGDPASGATFADLVEWRAPASPLYTGSSTAAAPALVEVRRWRNWTLYNSTPSWQDVETGGRIGGLLFDPATNVVWYQIYNYYNGVNHPFLGATQLLDAPDSANGGDFAAVGAKYGPWWYRSTDAAQTYWKMATNWMISVPADARSDLRGHATIVGGGVGSVAGSGNLGPGFAAIDLPALTSPPNSVVPLGTRLADYSFESTQSPSSARRKGNYSIIDWPGHATINVGGLYLPDATSGFWCMSLDEVNSFAWVQTPTQEGILMFGYEVSGKTGYGFNPMSLTAGWAGSGAPDLNDLSRGNPSRENGYAGEVYTPMLFEYDASEVRQVGNGQRSPFNDGINPKELGNWHAAFPNIPLNKIGQGAVPGPVPRPLFDYLVNTAYWDSAAQQLIWIQPGSTADYTGTLHVFIVGNGPAPPSNVRVIR